MAQDGHDSAVATGAGRSPLLAEPAKRRGRQNRLALAASELPTRAAPLTQAVRSKWPSAQLEDVIAFSPFVEPQPPAEAEPGDELALLESF